MTLRHKILEFLYTQTQKKSIQFIKSGMVEDFEEFVTKIISERELGEASDRMRLHQAIAEEKAEGEKDV